MQPQRRAQLRRHQRGHRAHDEPDRHQPRRHRLGNAEDDDGGDPDIGHHFICSSFQTAHTVDVCRTDHRDDGQQHDPDAFVVG